MIEEVIDFNGISTHLEADYPLIAIDPMSTLSRSGSTW